ncbi:hypothetical protein EYV94_23310 [Puteibacter caeruleilacunae]|nr:hypothetical protein EYV94_23310 [Puteibacter caeruleilacunae]
MKRTILFFQLLIMSCIVIAQEYNTKQLQTVAQIWGECYLFHPSIVRADKDVNWEKQLVKFLPTIKETSPEEAFLKNINSKLLIGLDDPFTVVQPYHHKKKAGIADIGKGEKFDYVRISNDLLSNVTSFVYLDSVVTAKQSSKPLVLDCRISAPLDIDWHSYSPFHYLMSMFIAEDIYLGQSVTREHFGWDEYNDWWYYEQRWKIAQDDRDQPGNGKLMPLGAYQQKLQQYLPECDFSKFTAIERPLYLVVNNSFLSYYGSLVQSLQLNRANTFVIAEDKGPVFAGQQGLKEYSFDNYEFILNTSFYFDKATTELDYDYVSNAITSKQIDELIGQTPKKSTQSNFSLHISPRKYESVGKELTVEEKILGVMKVWTIVKHFYPYLEQCNVDWAQALETYLEEAQTTHSDKEYYEMIQKMMASLHDSHVSTFHPSILDFSKIFVAPVKFEWLDDRVVVTSVDKSVEADIHVGDVIAAIDGLSINDILKAEAQKVSSTNRQGLLATVINPGYFTGAPGSAIEFTVIDKGNEKAVKIPRTMHMFQFMGAGDKRPACATLDNNIGYLNLAMFQNSSDLENELEKMKNTHALIIDLRSSYPTADYQTFLQMLCQQSVPTRLSEVPVVSACDVKDWEFEMSKINPGTFTYAKPIAVLVDKTMISRPEDIAICLKAFPNVTFVGEQTQGTDGEMTKIHLPGGGETSFTGQIIRFGNGDKFQGTGIIPDVVVERTVAGVKNNKDEILEKAVQVILAQ